MAKHVRLLAGAFDGDNKVNEEKTQLDKPALLVYMGKFDSMDGEVEIGDEDIEKLAANHNTFMAKLSRMANGEASLKHNPPVQLDHSTSAKDTVGRLIGNLTVGTHKLEDGTEVKALYGTPRILGKENVEKVMDGRWTHLSGGFDLENHKITELTITPFPAAPDASMLSRRRARMAKQSTYKDCKIDVYQSEAGEWIWSAVDHAGSCKSEAEAIAEAKKAVDEFVKKHPNLSAGLASLKDQTQLPGHPDEALWDKAKKASEEAFGEVRWPFVNWWYQNQGGKLSSKEDTMGYKELKTKMEIYSKCKKHLMDEKKMSEEDADKHLEAAKEEELSKMASEHDEHLKRMADDEAKKKEEELKRMGSLSAHKSKLVQLSKDMKAGSAKIQLAAKKSQIVSRLSGLRAQAKISPSEIKALDLNDLAGKSDEVVDAVIKTYEKREMVIDTGLVGSTKAMNPSQLTSRLKKMNMEREELQTRLNMPSKREAALKRLSELDEQEKSMGHAVDGVHQEVGPDHMAAFESAYGQMKKLMEEGKHDEAKEHMRKHHLSYAVGPQMTENMPVSDPTPEMKSLAADVKKMQTDFDEIVKLAAPVFGATPEELV